MAHRIPPEALARCLRYQCVWRAFTTSSAVTEEPMGTVHWPARAKFAEYIVLTQPTGTARTVTIGYAANGGSRSAKSVAYYVAATTIALSQKIGSNVELTLVSGQDEIKAGEMITCTFSGTNTAGKILVKLWYECEKAGSDDMQIFASTSSTSTTSTTSSTTTVTTSTSTTTTTTGA